MWFRLLAAPAAALALAAPVQAADAGLLSRLVGRDFVVPDAQARPVPLTFAAPEAGVVEVRIGGEAIERYRVLGPGLGEHIHLGAPDLVSRATFSDAGWSRTYKGLTITYSLEASGDIVARRSGALEDWHASRTVFAHNPSHADLAGRLSAALEEVHEEAERYEGHDHAH